MLPPSELKNKNFTHVIRGYSSVEVDEHIAFIIEKYTELYRENDALERKIAAMQAEIDKYRNDEESIRSALINAQRASSQILEDANERSEIILRSAKINCDKILAEFKGAVKEERDELLLLRGMVKKFKEDLFLAYQEHIEQIERIAPELDSLDESEFADEAIVRLAVESIKRDIISGAVEQSTEDDDSSGVKFDEGKLQIGESAGDVTDASVATDDELVAADELFNGSEQTDDLDNTAVDMNAYIDSEAARSASGKYEQLTYDELMAEARSGEEFENMSEKIDTDTMHDSKDDADGDLSNECLEVENAFSAEISDEPAGDVVQLGMNFEESNDDYLDASSDFKTDDSYSNEVEDALTDYELREDAVVDDEKQEKNDDSSYGDGETLKLSATDISEVNNSEVESIEFERKKIEETVREQTEHGVVESILEINDILAQDVGASKQKKAKRTASGCEDEAEDAEYIEFLKTVTDSVKKKPNDDVR